MDSILTSIKKLLGIAEEYEHFDPDIVMYINQNVNKVIYGGRVLIDLTGDTVDPSKLLKGSKAHDKSGAQIEGACTFDVDSTDATAVAAEILFGKTAYVSGNKLTGTMKKQWCRY